MWYKIVLPHGNSSKTEHPYIRTSQYVLNAERQLLESNKPHKVYEDLVAAADPRNLKQIQNGKYLIQKKTKANEKVIINRFLFLAFLLLVMHFYVKYSFGRGNRQISYLQSF